MTTATELKYPPKILGALNAVMNTCGYVRKKGENKFHGYKYAGESNLLEALRPAMVEHGLILIPSHTGKSEIDQYGNMFVTVEYTLAHKDGDVWPEKIIAFGAGNDKNKSGNVGDKGLYKALTGANKYLLFKLFQIETGDDPEKDSDADKAPAPANDPPETIKSAPGVSKVRTWVSAACREIQACSDADSLMTYLSGKDDEGKLIYDRAVAVCKTFPELWTGPEDFAGLRGNIQQVAGQLRCAREATEWIERVQTAARAEQPKKAA